ncbi:hypothetical protein FACS189490_05280 [Clostridia bacterium]|nr:hypothetical protein FACS189490_05280 [Clostridia bacterium]
MRFLGELFVKRFVDVQKVHTGEMMTLLSDDVAAVANYFPDLITGIFGNIVLVSISVTALFFLNWKLALVLLISTPLLIVLLNLFAPFIQKSGLTNKNSEEENRKFMQDSVGKLLLFKTYGMAEKVASRGASLYGKKYKTAVQLSILEGFSGFMNILFGMSMFLIILGVGAYFALRGEVAVGTLVAMLQLMNTVINPFSAVSRYIAQIASSKASAERLRKVLDLPQESVKLSDSLLNPTVLRAKNVRFAYEEDEVLKGASLEAKTGEIVGIIGESGSGKSTLTKILMGLYEPKNGHVELITDNGVAVSDVLSFISYVPSDNFLFNGTICDNITMGKELSRERLENALKSVNIYDFVTSLPKSYDEIVGEGANALSSGQAQRIGIARALYKNSPVIIFDEPTSNLDGESRTALKATIKNIAKNKICLLITHDMQTKDICNKIYVINDGIAKQENGSEQSLV